jgi:putative hydrolase of the HAD superfamily
VSEDLGISKPDPRIFEHTLEGIKDVAKNEILMIGDSLRSDIKGGMNYGIDTCWYNPNKLVNNTDVEPSYEIDSLLELIEIIE